MTLSEALATVQRRRPQADPIPAFIDLLQKFEQTYRDAGFITSKTEEQETLNIVVESSTLLATIKTSQHKKHKLPDMPIPIAKDDVMLDLSSRPAIGDQVGGGPDSGIDQQNVMMQQTKRPRQELKEGTNSVN
jgi:hypothetical protein